MGVEFTVGIPTHNRRETAAMAVRSVLAQTRPAKSVVVLCDGCDDGTAEAVRALGAGEVVALELEKGPGYGYAHRNRVLDPARAEVITWLADDDLWLPGHLERIGALWDRGDVDLVQSGAVLIDPADRLEWLGADWSVPEHRERIARHNPSPMAAVSVRAELALAVGGWDGAQERKADWDLWRRMLAAGARSAMSPEATHLHFRATGREQSWEARVAQNAAWLERTRDPAALARLRVELQRVRERRDADWLDLIEQGADYRERLEQERLELVERLGVLDAALQETGTALAAADERVLAVVARAEDAEARAGRLDAELTAARATPLRRLGARLRGGR